MPSKEENKGKSIDLGKVKTVIEAKKKQVKKNKNGTTAPDVLKDNVPVVITKNTRSNGKAEGRRKEENDLLHNSAQTLKNPSTYILFCDWIATPEMWREPKTQKEFSAKYKVSERTLTEWKQRKNFWVIVNKNIKRQWREKGGNAVQALYMNLLKKGSSQEFLAFMGYVMGYNPRTVEPERPERPTYDNGEINQISEAMKNAGLVGASQEHEKLAKLFNSDDVRITEADDIDDFSDDELDEEDEDDFDGDE